MKSLKILENAKTAFKFCFSCSERLIFDISIYGLLLVNWHGQIYPGQQIAKKNNILKSENYC